MVIGLMVHAGHRALFEEAARTLSGVTLAWAVYEHEDEICERVASLLRGDALDGVLLGPVPYARARVGLQNLLLNTPEFADAWIENRGRRGVVVFVHAALFEEVTRQWVELPVLGRAEDALGVRAAAGFGIGASARSCVALAERAAARAEQHG